VCPVRGVVQGPALPRRQPGLDQLGLRTARPPLERFELGQSVVVQVGQAWTAAPTSPHRARRSPRATVRRRPAPATRRRRRRAGRGRTTRPTSRRGARRARGRAGAASCGSASPARRAPSVGRFRVGTSTSMTPSRELGPPALGTGTRIASTRGATKATGARLAGTTPTLARPAGARPRTRSPDRQTGPSDSASQVGPVADRVRAAHARASSSSVTRPEARAAGQE